MASIAYSVPALLLACLACSVTADASAASPAPPPSFREVLTRDGKHQGLFAGGHPKANHIVYLKNLRIRTVLSLQTGLEATVLDKEVSLLAWLRFDSPEHKSVRDNGMAFIRDSWSASATMGYTYTEKVVAKLKSLLATPSKSPVYLHCEYGMDRTGAIVALHRVMNESWTPQDAFREWRGTTHRCALSMGQFDKTFNNMIAELKRRTGDPKYDFRISPVKEECMRQ